MEFTQKDLEQIQSLGIKQEVVAYQLDRFKNGFPDLELCGTVLPNEGLVNLTEVELTKYIDLFDEQGVNKELVKFVPASGAASRMFKMLYNYLEGAISFDDKEAKEYFESLKGFAFSDELLNLLGDDTEAVIASGDKRAVDLLLSDKGLNYGFLPKALLSFHKYEDGTVTKAIDEHLIEGAQYSADKNGVVRLHFTVSVEHVDLIKAHISKVQSGFESKYAVNYSISYSVQDKATDTLAVDMDNNPFRTDNGELLFRPGGHGALLKNLDAIDGDIVFIKNIDNVAAGWLINDTITYKKALGGVLVETQNQVFDYCKQLKGATVLAVSLEEAIVTFLDTKLGYKVSPLFSSLSEEEKISVLFNKLNRPIRICGVVAASGTGGGPFWVKHSDGTESLQLVETAQVNLDNKEQVAILDNAQYANITDLICGVKDFEGNLFDLMQYRDPDTGFIAEKSAGGKALKAMELPGLWNGAMSDWNTAFVQVPMSTFNPVKTVLDLLKKEHQGIQ